MTATIVKIPASIRNRNPGSMWPGAASAKFGATAVVQLTDAQRNKMAVFPTSVDGASAMFYLLRTSSHYIGQTIGNAISTWSGGNSINDYLRVIEAKTRWTRQDYITPQLLEDRGMAIELGKAMAWHEAGREYPMTDAQWVEAHQQFMTVLKGGKVALDRVNPLPVTAPLELAKTFIGQKRIPGSGTNPVIEDLFKEIGSKIRGDDESFCAAGVGACLKRTGHAYVPAPQGQMARSYLNYGHALDEPEEGCIVVQWRVKPDSIWGHVEFVESWTATHLTVVGFNVGGAVVRRTIPRLKSNGGRVLGYRRPVSTVTPAREVLKDDEVKRDSVGLLGTLITLFYVGRDWLGSILSSIGELVGILPDAADTASSAVSTGQALFGAAGVPWPLKLGLAIVAISIVINLRNRWKRKRVNAGKLTRPPYETDEETDPDAAGSFDGNSLDDATQAARDLIMGPIADRLSAAGEARQGERRKRPIRKPAGKKAPARKKAAKKSAKRRSA